MVGHRPQFHTALQAAMVLHPLDEEAAATSAEDIEEDDHHPHAKRRRHDEVFGARATDLLQFGTREVFKGSAVDGEGVMDRHTIDILADRLHDTIAHQVAVDTIALSVIGKEKLHPACPEEQCPRKSEAGLPGVALDENTSDRNDKSHEPHGKSRIMERGRGEEMLHQNHQRMAKRHEQQDDKDSAQCLAWVFFLFHSLSVKLIKMYTSY